MNPDPIHSEEYLKYLQSLPKNMLLLILENIFDEVFVSKPDGTIIYVNPACMRHYLIKPDELVGKKCLDVSAQYWKPCYFDFFDDAKEQRVLKYDYFLAGKEYYGINVPVINPETNEVEIIVSCINEDLRHAYEEQQKTRDETITEFSLEKYNDHNIVSNDPQYRLILRNLLKIADSMLPVILTGESGTGKNFLAKYIHDNSARSDQPFITVNCTSIPVDLIESELFGYAPNSFTGASAKGKKGLFELANGGTVFLDEIAEIPLNIQIKLLRVLEYNKFYPIGSVEEKNVDIRIVAATNKNIEEYIREKKFREDLFWRINTVLVTVPPLRERTKDILPLLNLYLEEYNKKYKTKKILGNDAIMTFLNYKWPGNIRELKNVIEYCVVVSLSDVISTFDLPPNLISTSTNAENGENKSYKKLLDNFSKALISQEYKKCNNVRQFAKNLDLSLSSAYRLLRNYYPEFLVDDEN